MEKTSLVLEVVMKHLLILCNAILPLLLNRRVSFIADRVISAFWLNNWIMTNRFSGTCPIYHNFLKTRKDLSMIPDWTVNTLFTIIKKTLTSHNTDMKQLVLEIITIIYQSRLLRELYHLWLRKENQSIRNHWQNN